MSSVAAIKAMGRLKAPGVAPWRQALHGVRTFMLHGPHPQRAARGHQTVTEAAARARRCASVLSRVQLPLMAR